MRVLVCGGRDYDNAKRVNEVLNIIRPAVVIEGGAYGADALAADWAKANLPKQDHLTFKAAWTDLSHPDAIIRTRRDGTEYDAKAGHRRNQRMIDEGKPEMCIAFPGGTGTADMIVKARTAGVLVLEIDRQ